jgi:hypothetical protein
MTTINTEVIFAFYFYLAVVLVYHQVEIWEKKLVWESDKMGASTMDEYNHEDIE